MTKGKDKHRPDDPVTIPAVTESLISLVEVRISAPVNGPIKLLARWEIGDDTGDSYLPIRQGSHEFVDTPGETELDPTELDAYLHDNAASQQTVLENLHKAVYQLLVDRELIPSGAFE